MKSSNISIDIMNSLKESDKKYNIHFKNIYLTNLNEPSNEPCVYGSVMCEDEEYTVIKLVEADDFVYIFDKDFPVKEFLNKIALNNINTEECQTIMILNSKTIGKDLEEEINSLIDELYQEDKIPKVDYFE